MGTERKDYQGIAIFHFALLTGMYYFYRDKDDLEPERLISEDKTYSFIKSTTLSTRLTSGPFPFNSIFKLKKLKIMKQLTFLVLIVDC
mgnify:CR=1 FL=1